MIPLTFMTCAMVMNTWAISVIVIYTARRERVDPARWARWCWAELRPSYLPAIAAYAIAAFLISPWTLGANVIAIGLGLLVWHLGKDIDDDERWKRRKAKLAAKVSRKRARLVVVPVTVGVR
jgi:hypothetical protein